MNIWISLMQTTRLRLNGMILKWWSGLDLSLFHFSVDSPVPSEPEPPVVTTRPEIATTSVQRSSDEDHVRRQFLSLTNKTEICLQSRGWMKRISLFHTLIPPVPRFYLSVLLQQIPSAQQLPLAQFSVLLRYLKSSLMPVRTASASA